jgi:hypothetical protein
VVLALFTIGCGTRTLTVKPSKASGTDINPPDSGGRDTMAVTDASNTTDEAQGSTCEFLDTKLDPSANLLGDFSGCPVSLADLPARCGQNPAQLVRCSDYVQVYFPPDPPEGDRQGEATCYYTPDGTTLIGGSVVYNVYGEDAFPSTAGRLPQGCEATCGPVEYVCPGQQAIDGGIVASSG